MFTRVWIGERLCGGGEGSELDLVGQEGVVGLLGVPIAPGVNSKNRSFFDQNTQKLPLCIKEVKL